MRDNARRSLLVICTAAALLLRLRGITFGLPYLNARPDEATIVTVASGMRILDLNPHFFNYPTAYIYVVAAAARIVAAIGGHLQAIYLTDRVIVAVLGAATVPLLYFATKRLLDRDTAIVAALLAATAFLLVRDAHFGVTDVPAAFMIVLAFLYIVGRPFDSAHWPNVIAAAVLCGMAAATKYNAALIIAPFVIAVAMHDPGLARRPAAFAALFLTIGVCAACGFLFGTPYAVLDYAAFKAGIVAEGRHLIHGHGIDLGRGWYHHLTFSLPYAVGWPMLLLAVSGAAIAAFRDWKRAMVLLAFPVLYYAGIGAGRSVFIRYVIPLVPFICILAAIAITSVGSRLSAGGRYPAAGAAIAGVLLLAIVVPNIRRSIAFDRVLLQTDTRVQAAEALVAAYPGGAVVYEINGSPFLRLTLPPVFRQWNAAPGVAPDLVVVKESPLTLYTPPVGAVDLRLLQRGYRRVATFGPEMPGAKHELIYDLQDAFFVPLDGLEQVRRPGPAIEIYERMNH